MKRLLRVYRYLFLGAVSLPLFQIGSCAVDPDTVGKAFDRELYAVYRQLFSSMFTLLVRSIAG